MTRPAQAFEVAVIISAAVSLRDDVVDTRRLLHHTLSEMFLTQPFVTLQDAGPDDFPLRPIAALVARLSWFVLAPAFAFVLLAVT